jgi:HSP20 family molecular chaperone IbpA
MPDKQNPYDDFLKSLAKLVEDLMKDLPDEEHGRFIGCTIIAGGTPDTGQFFKGSRDNERVIQYEIIESEDRIFITTQLPPDIKNAPYADIDPDSVRLSIDDLEARIPLPVRIDVIHSFYMVRHGVMDVVLKKKSTAPDIT